MSTPFQNGLARLLTGCVFIGSLGLSALLLSGDLPAQQTQGKKPRVVEEDDDKQPKKKPPIVEEEEDKGPKQKKKVIRVDDDDAPKTTPNKSTGGGDGISGDLKALKDGSKHSGLRELGRKLFTPHDFLNTEFTSRKDKLAVMPLAKDYGHDPKLERLLPIVPFDQEWKAGTQYSLSGSAVKRHTTYEELAQTEVENFLKEKAWDSLDRESNDYLSKRDSYAQAAHVLSEVDKWHRSARSKGTREGDEWDKIQKALQDKIVAYRELQLEQVLLENDWEAASYLAREIGRSATDRATQERLAKRLANYIVSVLASGNKLTSEQLTELRDRLRQLELEFPGSSAVNVIAGQLKGQAERLFNDAKAAFDRNDNQAGIGFLRTALDLYPQLPDLQTTYLQKTNAYPTLKVGVRSMPEFMAPGIALTESERNAMEMIFEGLISQVPVYTGDEVAEHYERGLAEDMPQQTAQLVRRFRLSRNSYWAKPNDPRPLTANDVRATYQFLTIPSSRFYNPAWKELVDNVITLGDERQLSVALKHGFVDPYAAMTFKVLPDEAGAKDFKDGFARTPFGSGPYVLGRMQSIDGENRREFLANRFYGSRPGRLNMPRIREVYMSLARPETVVAEFRKGTFDVLLPDVIRSMGPGGVEALRKAGGINVVGPLPTRRIYFLAINLRKPVFESVELRIALAYAIQRADILKTVFGGMDGDKTLRGPYPTGSWACDPKDTKELDNLAFAKQKINEGEARKKLKGSPPLSLLFPQGNKEVQAAMEAIAAQLQATLEVAVVLQPTNEHDLRDKVEKSHAFDLAYYHYDFPSEAYWLWPLFHPEGSYFGSELAEDGTLSSLFRQAMARRDPAELQKMTHDIHNYLKNKMYIIPLWQLGSYVALRDDIRTPPLDPLRVLADVDKWRRKARQ